MVAMTMSSAPNERLSITCVRIMKVSLAGRWAFELTVPFKSLVGVNNLSGSSTFVIPGFYGELPIGTNHS